MKRRRRAAWVLSALLLLSGGTAPQPAVTPAPEESPTPTHSPAPTSAPAPVPTPEPVLRVHTDYSALTPPEPLEAVGGRWYEAYTDRLIPCEDYGMLLPYAGRRLTTEWYVDTGCLFGLMTADGTAVTDPVYGAAYRPGYYHGGKRYAFPLLVLKRGGTAWAKEGEPVRLAVAAADGSWCTEWDYRSVMVSPSGLLLLTADGLALMDPQGTLLNRYTSQELGLSPEEFQGLKNELYYGDGFGGRWYGDYISLMWENTDPASIRLFRRSDGQQETMSPDRWDDYCRAEYPHEEEVRELEIREKDGMTVLTRREETYTIPHRGGRKGVEIRGELVFFAVDGAVFRLDGTQVLPGAEGARVKWIKDAMLGDEGPGLLAVAGYDGEDHYRHYYRTDGTPIPFLDGWEGPMEGAYRQINLVGGVIETLDLNEASYYDLDTLECIFRTTLWYEEE